MNLRECLEIIIKRKKVILAIFFVSIIAAAAISFLLPKNFEVSTMIEPPFVGSSDLGKSQFVDSPLNIKAIVSEGAFDLKVVNALGLDPRKDRIKLKFFQPKETTVLKMSLIEPENKRDLGVKILNQFLSEMNNYYKNVIESKQADMDRRISIVANGIKDTRNSIKLNEENLKISEEREKELMGELRDTKANTEQLLIKRNALLERKVPGDDISSLLYSNTIQQNITYFSQLNNQIADIKAKKENIVNSIKALQNGINNSDIEIEKLKADKAAIRNIKLVKEPQASFTPVGLSKRKIVGLVGLLSLTLGILLAFFMEYWQKAKKI